MSGLPYKAKLIANYFIKIAEEEGFILTHMKLQKLIYFAHGWCLAIKGLPLIDEDIEAWEYGPVIPSVYYDFREFGSTRIKIRINYKDISVIMKDNFVTSLLEKVWVTFKGFSAFELSEMTHLPNSPWEQTRNKSTKINAAISDDVIQRHFIQLAKERLSMQEKRKACV